MLIVNLWLKLFTITVYIKCQLFLIRFFSTGGWGIWIGPELKFWIFLKVSNMSVDPRLCVVCLKDKHSRANLIRAREGHSNLCKPSGAVIYRSSNYFLSLIDDYSRIFFFWQVKNRVLNLLKIFLKNLISQTSKKIITFRTDNGLEYGTHNFKKLLSNHGIVRKLITRYTSRWKR